MKYLLSLIMALILTSCTTRTLHGECIGVTDKEQSNLVYEYDKKNIVLGVIFFETAIVPINVGLFNLKCPVDIK